MSSVKCRKSKVKSKSQKSKVESGKSIIKKVSDAVAVIKVFDLPVEFSISRIMEEWHQNGPVISPKVLTDLI